MVIYSHCRLSTPTRTYPPHTPGRPWRQADTSDQAWAAQKSRSRGTRSAARSSGQNSMASDTRVTRSVDGRSSRIRSVQEGGKKMSAVPQASWTGACSSANSGRDRDQLLGLRRDEKALEALAAVGGERTGVAREQLVAQLSRGGVALPVARPPTAPTRSRPPWRPPPVRARPPPPWPRTARRARAGSCPGSRSW